MFLYLTAVNQQQEERPFLCAIPELEPGLELLTNIVAQGNRLTSAYLVENDQRTNLPIEAFDGCSFVFALKQLEQEWQTILARTLLPDLPLSSPGVRWLQKKIDGYDQQIVELELMLSEADWLYHRAASRLRRGAHPTTNPYQSVVQRYTSQLRQAHLFRNALLKRFPT